MPKAPIEVRSYARQHTKEAIDTLVEIMRNPKCQSRSRVSAASLLLDRGWGKARETLEHGVTSELGELLQLIDGRTRGLPTPILRANGATDHVH